MRANAYSELILDLAGGGGEFRVPAIWPFEVANALLVAARRKRITAAKVAAVLQRISKLIIIVETSRAIALSQQVSSKLRVCVPILYK